MPSVSWLRTLVGTAVVGFVFLAHAVALRAQTTSASVVGSAKDPQGGIVGGASVTLKSRSQGDTLTATADDQGRFVFPIVRPDAYTLRVSKQGFKTAERTNVVVSANDRFSTGVITLDVGGIEESVSVLGRVSELQASSGERSYTLEGTAMGSIAVNGRSFFGLVGLVPGVLPNAGASRGTRLRPRTRPASPRTGSDRTRTTSPSTASPTSTRATTAATWRPRTSMPWRSSRS